MPKVPGSVEFAIARLGGADEVDNEVQRLLTELRPWLRTELRRHLEFGPSRRMALESRVHRRDALIVAESQRRVPRRTGSR